MTRAMEPDTCTWTAADLTERFGPIPLTRIRFDPPPGAATEKDVVEIHDREDRLCELVDGILLEKTVGAYESYLALLLGRLLASFVEEQDLGAVLGADGMIRIASRLVRIPDVAFIPWDRLPDGELPDRPILDAVPALAIEVISRGNTRQEMERKLSDYFAAGVREVWYVYHTPSREVWVYTAPEQVRVFSERDTLSGSAVLPGFALELKRLFARPRHG